MLAQYGFRAVALLLGLLAGAAAVLMAPASDARADNKIVMKVLDNDTGQPIAARMHLTDQRKRPVRPPGLPFWKDHFVFDGVVELELKPGDYNYEVDCGPEYRLAKGYVNVRRNSYGDETIHMPRFIDMSEEGWWAGDLHVHRPLDEIELLMRAEDLHVAPVITWWNDRNQWQGRELPEQTHVQFDGSRHYHVMAGEDERAGGALLYFNLSKPLDIRGSEREYPSPVAFLEQARENDSIHVDIEKPFWWDMPVWVASGLVDSIGMCHNHMHRDGVLDNEAWGKPRDRTLYPPPEGNGRWSWGIYYHLLNCGVRLPPSAGSASGVLPNPIGYNRVYVYCGETLDYDQWWENLRAGQVVVTNGPMLQVRFNGEFPGHVFQQRTGDPLTLQIELKLAFRDTDRVDYLEIVKDGKVVHHVRLDELAMARGQLPDVTFDESGWLLVRAISSNDKTFRFASSGPVYVEIGGKPRISKTSAQFFVDWVYERARQLQLDDAEQQADVLQYHRAARDYWQDLLERANVP